MLPGLIASFVLAFVSHLLRYLHAVDRARIRLEFLISGSIPGINPEVSRVHIRYKGDK